MREVQAARLLTSITEQLKQEELSRQNAENDFVEMECVLKKRVLYLEQYKAAVGGKMGRLQGRLDLSVPQEDYLAMQAELESLREDHLIALRREVEASIAALNSLEQTNDIRAFRLKVVQVESDLHNAQSTVKSLEGEISHQKEITHRTLSSENTPAEVSAIISEMARYRGESSRLEVEVIASKRRFDLLEEYSKTVETEVEECRSRIRELQDRYDRQNILPAAYIPSQSYSAYFSLCHTLTGKIMRVLKRASQGEKLSLSKPLMKVVCVQLKLSLLRLNWKLQEGS